MQEIYLSLASMSSDEGERLDENSRCTFSEERIPDLSSFYSRGLAPNMYKLLTRLLACRECLQLTSFVFTYQT